MDAVTSVKPNVAVATMPVPDVVRTAVTPRARVEAQQLAAGVWLLGGGTHNSLLVEFKEFAISIPDTIVPDSATVTRMQQDILDRTAAIPGVTSVAFTTRLPMGSGRSSSGLSVEGESTAQPAPNRAPPDRQVKIVSPGFFRTLGTPLVTGRDFAWTDVHGARDVAIVSENLARELFGSPDAALGRRVREMHYKGARWKEIVGVAGDIHDDGVDRPAPATIYWPVHPRRAHPGYERLSSAARQLCRTQRPRSNRRSARPAARRRRRGERCAPARAGFARLRTCIAARWLARPSLW